MHCVFSINLVHFICFRTAPFLWVSSIVFQGFNLDIQLAYVKNAFEPGINMLIFATLPGCGMAIFTISAYFTEYLIYILSFHAMGVSSLIFSVEMQHFPLLMPHDSRIIPCYGLLLGLFASFYAYGKIVDILGLYYMEKENPYKFEELNV